MAHNKRKILGLIGCIALIGVVSAVSISYLQSKSVVTNKFTVGHNDTQIVETYTKPGSISNGQVINKKVQVKNNSNVPCYVRVFAVPSSNPGGSVKLNIEGTVDGSLSTTTGKDWFHEGGDDAYYYYKKVLNPGETTTPLFNSVTVVNASYNADLNESLTAENLQVIVYEESQQSEGHSSPVNAFK